MKNAKRWLAILLAVTLLCSNGVSQLGMIVSASELETTEEAQPKEDAVVEQAEETKEDTGKATVEGVTPEEERGESSAQDAETANVPKAAAQEGAQEGQNEANVPEADPTAVVPVTANPATGAPATAAPVSEGAAPAEEAPAPEVQTYNVKINKSELGGGQIKVWGSDNNKVDVTEYDGNNQYVKEVKEGEEFNFQITLNDGFEIAQVKVNGNALDPANTEGNVITYKVAGINEEKVIDVTYNKVETPAEEKAAEEPKTEDETKVEEPAVENPTASAAVTATGEIMTDFYVKADRSSVTVGDTVNVKAIIKPDEFSDKRVTWESSDETIATVDENGLVTTRAIGTVRITGKSEANPDMTDFDIITVNPIQVSKITITGYAKEYMLPNETVKLDATVEPDNAADKSVIWTSSDETIATVDQNGNVNALKQGEVTIRVAANDASGKYAEQKIKVYDAKPQEATVQVWVTNQYRGISYTINIPADGTEVNASDVIQKVDGYVSTNIIRVGTWESGSTWSTIQKTNPVQKFRYNNNRIQYTTNGYSWSNVSSNKIVAFYAIKTTAELGNTDVGVAVGDWPYGPGEATSHTKQTIRIKIVVDGSNNEIYNSGLLRYDNRSNGEYGKIEFDCDESRYEIKEILVYKNDSGTGKPLKTYTSVPTGGISVKFTDGGTNHYLVKAVVKPKEFDVTYDINGGEGKVPASTKLTAVDGQQVTVATSPQPTKEGYIFAGWEYDGTTYYGGESFEMPPHNVTFKAKWLKTSGVITYSSNNEEWGTVSRSYETLKDGSTETRGSVAKANEGCVFAGWKNNQTGEIVSNELIYKPIAEPGSYTAVFKANINKYLELKTNDVTAKYDGKDYATGTATVKDKATGKVADDVTIKYQKADGSWTTNPSEITATNVSDSKTVQVRATSEKYTGELTGTEELTITKRDVTLISTSDEKVYDGTALTNKTVTESGDKFVDGEGATYDVTGSQTLVGSSANTFSYTLNEGTNADNYTITKNEGTLTVTNRPEDAKYEITVTANSTTATYDGKPHTAEGLETTTFVVDGNTYTVEGLTTEDPSKTDAGTYTNNITGTAVVKDAAGNVVTDQFVVKTTNGSLTINKADVTLKSADLSKVYDGNALVNGETALATETGWAEGEGATYSFTGSQTLVGSSANTFSYTLNSNTKAANYKIGKTEGTLTVTNRPEDAKYEITVTANSTTATYDGKEHKAEGVETYEFTVAGHKYKVSGLTTENPKATNAGTYTNNITGTAVVKDASGNDVTAQFIVKTENGKLVINKASVTLKSADLTQKYNGKALVNGETALETETGWAKGEGATYSFTGSQTLVGISANTFSYTLNNNTKAANYEISKTEGTLTVTNRDTKYEITVKANSTTATYDGKPHTAEGLETTTFVVDGNTYTVEGLTTEDPSKTDAGTYTNNITGTAVVKDAAGNVVTDQFVVKTTNGSLTINKADVTLKSADLSKVYDGNALVNGETALATETGWAEGEGATYSFTGSQTLVGSSANTFSYTLNSNTKAANYKIGKTEGTLTVTNRPEDAKYEITVTANSTTATYDGKEHKAEGVETYEFTVAGHKYKVSGLTTENPKATNAGTYTNNITGTAVVKDASGNDVTAQFIVKTENGKLVINKASVTLKSADLTQKYNGKALVNGETALETETGWAKGEGATYSFTGSQTLVGSSANAFSYTLNEGTNADNYTITKNEGTLTVTNRPEDAKYEITVTANSTTATYDGKPHTAEGLETTTFVVDGNTYTVEGLTTEDPSKTDAGTYTNNITGTAVVKDAAGNVVTDQFVVKTTNGSLTINKADVTLKSADLSKVYDGNALVNGETALATEEGWADSDKASVAYNFTGSQTNVGSSDNTFTVKWNDTVKESNYNVTIEAGTLTVTAQSIDPDNPNYKGITVDAPTDVEYTGEDQTWLPTVTDGNGKALVKDTDYTVTYDNEDRTNVTGTITVTINGAGNYAGTITRTYQITPKPVTITTESKTKAFDGTALTAGGKVEGIVSGETYGFEVTGSQTYVGSSPNTYEMVWADSEVEGTSGTYTAKKTNYTVTESIGTLAVTAGTPENPLDPTLVVNKTHDKSQTYKAGDVITFTITAKNIYEEAKTITLEELEGVALDANVFENVAPGAEVTATATYTVTEQDIVNGTFTNNVTVTFSGVDDKFTGTDTVDELEDANPHMTITKTTVGADAGHIYKLGEVINYKITATNDGNLTLTNVKVEDALTGNVGENAFTIDTLAPGEAQTFDVRYVVTENDVLAGKVINNATGTATDPTDPDEPKTPVTPGEKEDPIETPNPSLAVVKTSDKTGVVKLGETITYTITVTNNGNVTINDIEVTDELTGNTGDNAFTIDRLAVGETKQFTATYTVTEDDILEGTIVNRATATGKDPRNEEVTGEGEVRVDTEEKDDSKKDDSKKDDSKKNDSDKKPGAVKTGDATDVIPFFGMTVLAAGAAIVIALKKKRRA